MALQPKNPRTSNRRSNLFKFDIKAENLQKTFNSIYEDKKGDWSAIKPELTEEKGFTPNLIRNLEFTHNLSLWSEDNNDLVTLFQKDQDTNSMRDIAFKYNKAKFIDKVKVVASSRKKNDKEAFALDRYKTLFHLEPTAMLVNLIKDPQVPLLNNAIGAYVANVLEMQPDFNIKTTSVYEIIKNRDLFKEIPVEDKEPAIKHLKILQRITAISPVPDAIPVLFNANLQTAFQISEIPPSQFKLLLKEKGLDEATLNQIHLNAQFTRVRNEQALMALKEAGRETGVALIDKSLKSGYAIKSKARGVKAKAPDLSLADVTETELEKHNLSWDLLFGDADFCECSECTSVYSASSYFVELLQYLRNNNLDPSYPNTGEKGISGTPVEKLFERRPDLGCLELTCENTNTILPYVDLVNEVMENYVAFKRLKPFNVDDEISSELLAEPQHTEYQAYCILKNTVYPFTLPYHQPIDAARIYLEFLDTSRHELICKFRKNIEEDDSELKELKDEALDRAYDAEYLGLTKEEYIILTKECFESKALIDKIKDKIHTDAEYQELIGVKPVCQYFGYDDDITMLSDSGLTQIKKEFLRRTGIDYLNLVDLLKTEYINPCVPEGKSRTIMESLRFSYRFLQNYAKANGIDKMSEDLVLFEKFADLFPLLKELIESLTIKKTLICPKNDKEGAEITNKDIIHWVKCHFEKIGKMIVIESGRGCVDGVIVPKEKMRAVLSEAMGEVVGVGGVSVSATVKDCKISFGETEVGSIDNKTGKVSFTQQKPDQKDLDKVVFRGLKGEIGTFLYVNDEIYLIFLEQKDSCNLDTALLQHLDGSSLTVDEYDRIHRFIRLWHKLDWTIDETDKAIVGLSVEKVQEPASGNHPNNSSLCIDDNKNECKNDECDECEEVECAHHFDINTTLIHQLVAVKKLLDKTGLDLIKLLTFWTTISTAGETSLYKRLFLKHNVLGIDKIFKADDNGNYLTGDAKITEHIPVVMASLNLSADDILAIMDAVGIEDKLSLSNLSILYRYRLLSKALSLKIPAFINILPIFGAVFLNADETLKFMKRWTRMEEAGFTHQQLNYIIRNFDEEKKSFTPTQKAILQLAKTLYDGLNAIDVEHQDLKADEIITDPALRQLNIQEKATSALIRVNASLLFDTTTVEKIIGLLEGTSLFITNAPKSLTITLSDNKTLSKKLQYNSTQGTIQITGILTEAESIDYKALSNDPQWLASLTRIQKQQNKLFKELLSGVFEHEKTKPDTEKEQLKAILQTGDISIPLDQIPEGQADTNSAPTKRSAFLTIFLPYLRQELTHRFIVSTISNFAGLGNEVTDVLISETLKIGTPSEPLFSVFEKIKESTKPADTNWSGYLIPASQNSFTFIVKDSDTKPVITVDGMVLNFTVQEDPTNEWWSANLELKAGKLYKLITVGVELKNIYWKTPASSITPVPSSALIPDFASEQCKPALIAIKKASMLVSVFDLSGDEIKFMSDHKSEFDNIDFNVLTVDCWLRLEAYTRLRNSLPQVKLNMLDFWKWIYDSSSDAAKLSEKIAELTAWKKERIDKLIAANHFNISKPEDYRNEKNLLKLQRALKVADKIGMDIDLLFEWAVPISRFNKCREIAESIKNAIRARYNQTDWEQVVKPLHDQLRNNQRDALTAYLLQQKELIDWGVTDSNGLFEYFLIDVQMDACMETSRIKQAISSVQLFIQRCFLGLEEEYSKIAPGVLDRDRWDWIQRYRVWEANRKVFLYPENWIEGNLRDDKSPFFKELEGELLQKDINKQNVTDALKAYLYKVDEVANMEVVGLYIEGSKTGVDWDKDSKLHIFCRTRNAPYFFYYRYLALDKMNWDPWEKMQVDIPCYDLEDPKTKQIIGNGCYLTPVAWNKRLLVFFPLFLKKTRPAEPRQIPNDPNNANAGTHEATIKERADYPPEDRAPIECWEVKMAWSEYRNGKWTQKQLSTDVLTIDIIAGRRIDQFTFIPEKSDSKIIIHIEDQVVDDTLIFKGFTLSGSIFNHDEQIGSVQDLIPSSINTEFGTTSFQKVSNKIKSMQLNGNSWGHDDANFIVDSDSVKFEYINASIISQNFYYTSAPELLNRINSNKLDDLFNYNLDMDLDNFGPFDDDKDASTPYIYHELKRPYSIYNWELFFHTPTLLADALSKAQQFEEAMKWYHFVFNPMADEMDQNGNVLPTEKIDKRFWRFRPFREIYSQKILESIFNNLNSTYAKNAIDEWRDNPFMPHLVARTRPVAYMKWVVMKYIDNLLAWGDYLYRQDTIESINQATQLYVLAWHILGPRPMMIPKRGKIKPQTYLSLLDKWDAFGNAMVELELAAPFSNQTVLPFGIVNKEIAFANIFGLISTLYFCIPNNPKLLGYWDLVEDRLYKIRHCQNIAGIFRKLPLFEPPIDPALLVKAAAQGLSIASVLNDLNTPMPNYRFYYLLQKAFELCGEVKSMGSALLSAIEKKDNESIALIRAKHENTIQNLVMEIKKKQQEEAQKNVESLEQNRKNPEHRMKYYLQLIGEDIAKVPGLDSDFSELANSIEIPVDESGLKLIRYEKEDMDKASQSQEKQLQAALPEKIASILHILPNFSGNIEPFGIGMSITFGGSNLGAAAQAWAKFLQLDASELTYASTSAGKKGGFLRAMQERVFQANSAGYEIKQIDKQITAQKIRIEIANQEITNQQKLIDNALEVEEFLKNKYTNEELYTWMRGSLKTLYYQVYSLAYELAKKAEKVYRFERGLSTSNFIQSGYWDAGRDGLLAGEQLYVGLKQLESAYQNERGYDYEITKHVSLRQINPLAIIQLRETAKCAFEMPEVLFDMDYPGHFKRRIKSVSVSIPCVVGPYTGINSTLRLLENKFRNTSIGGKTYEEDTEETDERFSTYVIPISAIAASTAQNDSGMFELNFKDERYLPFEGAGVISKWRLELPELHQFDYNTISDVIIHFRYTSCEGGERLKNSAIAHVNKYVKANEELTRDQGLFIIVDLQHDLPTEWHKAVSIKNENSKYAMNLSKIDQMMPYFIQKHEKTLKATDIILATDIKADGFCLNEDPLTQSIKTGSLETYAITEQSLTIKNWELILPDEAIVAGQMFMVIRVII